MQKLTITACLCFLTACATTGERKAQPEAAGDSNPNGAHDFDKVIDENIAKFHRESPDSLPKSNAFDSKSLVIGKSEACLGENAGSAQPCPYADEKAYLKGKWPPNLGLALSGGGTRSASFALGVLKALEKQDILDKVDVMSSVSGGSYINYWYFSQLFYWDKIAGKLGKRPQEKFSMIFDAWSDSDTNLDDPDGYRFQRTLEQSSKILAFAHKPTFFNEFTAKIQYGVETMIQGLSVPIHWITNGLFDWELNITPYFYFYKDGLERTYGFVPLDYTLEHFANGKRAMGNQNIWAEPIYLTDFKAFFEEKKEKGYPYFVINTTASLGNSVYPYGENNDGKTMEKAVFEFTPWGCYSPLLWNRQDDRMFRHVAGYPNGSENYCPQDFHFEPDDDWNVGWRDMDVSRAVTISAAAVDGQGEFVDIAGREEANYTILGRKWYDLALEALNLNLGYQLANPKTSLFQRSIHKLLPWPLYVGLDYLLGNDSTSLHFSDGGHSENLGIFALVRRGVKNIIVVDSERDTESVFEGAKRFEQALEKHGLEFAFSQTNQNQVSVKDTPLQNAVIFGEVKTKKRDSGEAYQANVLYIKLSIPDSEALAKDGETLPYTVRQYLNNHPGFPHESTTDIFFSAEQVRAYRALGYTIATQSRVKDWVAEHVDSKE